jgi:pimeloyl-ACP methyl ester carboxylesterase
VIFFVSFAAISVLDHPRLSSHLFYVPGFAMVNLFASVSPSEACAPFRAALPPACLDAYLADSNDHYLSPTALIWPPTATETNVDCPLHILSAEAMDSQCVTVSHAPDDADVNVFYDMFPQALHALHPQLEIGETLHPVGYDWRLAFVCRSDKDDSTALSGTARYPHCMPDGWFESFAARIEAAYAADGRRITLVSHSNGGPVTLAFLHSQPASWVSKHVHAWINAAGNIAGQTNTFSIVTGVAYQPGQQPWAGSSLLAQGRLFASLPAMQQSMSDFTVYPDDFTVLRETRSTAQQCANLTQTAEGDNFCTWSLEDLLHRLRYDEAISAVRPDLATFATGAIAATDLRSELGFFDFPVGLRAAVSVAGTYVPTYTSPIVGDFVDALATVAATGRCDLSPGSVVSDFLGDGDQDFVDNHAIPSAWRSDGHPAASLSYPRVSHGGILVHDVFLKLVVDVMNTVDPLLLI